MPPILIEHIGFLSPGSYAESEPHVGMERTLQLLELGERLGYDSAWVRQRHLEPGISSAGVFLAAATQRTRRIELGTAVIPMGYESPYRLAEDLSMVDVLSGGRFILGLGASGPQVVEGWYGTPYPRPLERTRGSGSTPSTGAARSSRPPTRTRRPRRSTPTSAAYARPRAPTFLTCP